jgi:hypothetical protein
MSLSAAAKIYFPALAPRLVSPQFAAVGIWDTKDWAVW